MSEPCSLCLAEDAPESFPICDKCARRQGRRPFPPSRRPPVPCTRCNGQRFVRVMPREYTNDMWRHDSGPRQHAVPMALTAEPRTSERWIRDGRSVAFPTIENGLGTLEAYVCTACGFIDWYCQDPEALPIGPEYNTELVDYTTKTPYR